VGFCECSAFKVSRDERADALEMVVPFKMMMFVAIVLYLSEFFSMGEKVFRVKD